jgi:hypothetical protein
MKPSSRRRINQQEQKRPAIIFTVDDLMLLKKALVPLEKRILLTTEPLPNLQFALETVTQVQAKVNAMLGQSMWGVAVGFDENEVLILKTALWLYIAGLQMIKSVTEETSLLARCQRLSKKLESVR